MDLKQYQLNAIIATDSVMLVKSVCKNLFGIAFIKNESKKIQATKVLSSDETMPIPVQKSWIKIQGNFLYNFNYRSYLDTPFVEKDLIQQSVQTRFDVRIKEDYPFTIFLTHRNSNSSYFLNATDVSVQFKQANMLDGMKGKLRKEIDHELAYKGILFSPEQIYMAQKNKLKGIDDELYGLTKDPAKNLSKKNLELRKKITELYDEYKTKREKINQLQQWVNSPQRLQQIVEEKEKKIRDSMLAAVSKRNSVKKLDTTANAKDAIKKLFNKKPSFKGRNAVNDDSTSNASKNTAEEKMVKADSTAKSVSQSIEEKQKELDQLKKQLSVVENKLKLFQKKTRDSLMQLKQKLAAVNSSDALYDYMSRTQKSKTDLPALQRALLSIKQIGIGRSWIDYSDLTVKNISLNGANIELNPGKVYMAAAVGKVNYRFRDFVVKGDYAGSSQSLGLVRFGYGKKEGNNLIVTYYSGQKALLNQTGNADSMAVQKVSGISLESKRVIDQHNYIIAEYARSTYAGSGGKMLDFSSHTNEAWAIKLFSDYPVTHTKITAYYRKIGEGFQSFTLYPTNSNQEAWSAKVKQGFWKQKLSIEASVRKNDFNSPIAAPNFSSSTVFKSFQATMHIAKYPIVIVGFYPSSQLSLSNNNVLYEQQFNTLNAIISHSYVFGKNNINTSLVYTKFYNQGSDTGFIYYNASSCIINHSVYMAPFVFQGIVTLTKQTGLKQTTIEPVVTYQIKNTISLTGSLKWSKVNNQEVLWGSMAGVNMVLKNIGIIQLQYDKSYLPGYNRNLLPVSLGRVTFNREF